MKPKPTYTTQPTKNPYMNTPHKFNLMSYTGNTLTSEKNTVMKFDSFSNRLVRHIIDG